MRNILITLFCFIYFQVFSQNEKIIELRKSYRIANTDKSITLKFPEKKTILLDTTIVEIDSSQLSFLKDFKLFDDRNMYKKYKSHSCLYKTDRVLKQWIVPIKIYFDSKISSSVVNDFKKFVLPLNGIDNLNISFVSKLEDANYFFKVKKNEVSGYSTEDLDFFDEDEIASLPFLKMNYKSFSDENYKILNCIFEISPSALIDLKFLDNLKKGFYYSLTQFTSRDHAPEDSVLNVTSKNLSVLSEYDFLLLKFHYANIFTFKVDYKTLLALEKNYKSKNN